MYVTDQPKQNFDIASLGPGMPIISTFFGIVIRMFYQEHEPAHFDAEHWAKWPSAISMERSSPVISVHGPPAL